MMDQTIFIVEDDPEVRELMSTYLEAHQFRVAWTDRGDEAIRLVRELRPDLIILDIVLPGKNGFEVCKEVREISPAPIIFVSCQTEEHYKITGLGIGGDDYITKPFSPNELIARVKANLRRPHLQSEKTGASSKLRFGATEIDTVSRTVKVHDEEILLSKKEYELLSYLAGNPGRTITREELFREVWGQEIFNDTRTIIVHISNLRKKIERDPANPRHIINVHGVGYKFIYT
ncbi:DNA-binding response OmpR family regulator [Paenibacillus sp. OAS669]|nr:DNA-binding response OmpR family regulator [Paenibacillus sp. OAS669]